MTEKADFTEDDWRIVLNGPPTAGMIVATAQRRGTFREKLAIAKAHGEARKHHAESDLLDEIVSAKPEIDRTREHAGCEQQLPADAHANRRYCDRHRTPTERVRSHRQQTR